MGEIAIRAEGLGKRYELGEQLTQYGRLSETITEAVARPFRRLRGQLPSETGERGELWALRDVDLTLNVGEVLGVIGRNGAGKTTLLKLLSRITEPTTGYAELHGRVASLLEVGTGFHPELTGRENIFLNGAILGMPRQETARKFDEIVAFAEVERFIDTPVKRYSSGMYLRLAFAVAAHLEPDILIVDEVLAVGDAAFQKKSLGRMRDAAQGGKTVLFVSHQLSAVRRLCDRCIWLDEGRVRHDGPTSQVLGAYESSATTLRESGLRSVSGARFDRWRLTPSGDTDTWLTTTGTVRLDVVLDVTRPLIDATHGAALRNSEGTLVWAWTTRHLTFDAGPHTLSYAFESLPVTPGVYQWQFSVLEGSEMLDLWYAVPEMVVATQQFGSVRDEWQGILNVPCTFELQKTLGVDA